MVGTLAAGVRHGARQQRLRKETPTGNFAKCRPRLHAAEARCERRQEGAVGVALPGTYDRRVVSEVDVIVRGLV